jgi:ABC-type thiamin/hydroxymethylpyrimidine transport system permease subunit
MKITQSLAKVSAVATTSFTSLMLARATSAAGTTGAVDADKYLGEINTGTNENLMDLIFRLINWAIGIAAVLSVAILIAAGYMYITAAGDESKIEKATKTLTWAIIGLVIAFISVILVQFVLQDLILKGN